MQSNLECTSCNIRNMCITKGIIATAMKEVDKFIPERIMIKKGDFLYCEDEEFRNVYALKSGHFKTFKITSDQNEQVTSFAVEGEMLGFDVHNDRHQNYAQATEDSELCIISSSLVQNIFVKNPDIIKKLDNDASKIVKEATSINKIASFLLDLSKRYSERGFSPVEFPFRMSREDIGNYLGLPVEIIIKTINKFKNDCLIEVKNKEIFINDIEKIKQYII